VHQFLIGRLECPVCGATSPADTSTNIQIGELPVPTAPPQHVPEPYVRVKDRLPLRISGLERAGFLPTKPLADDAVAFRGLVPWTCPTCKTADQWAIVAISRDGSDLVIDDLVAVEMSEETLRSVDAVLDLLVEARAFGVQDWMSALRDPM
jgi:hypothetical protein